MKFPLLLVLIGVATTVLAAPVTPPPKEPDYGPVTDKHRETSQKNLKEIGLALHNYESAYGVLPNNYSADGKALLSWRVALLPFVGQEKLYRQFDQRKAWDSPENKRLIEQMPEIFAPVRVKAKPGETFYRGFTGKGTGFELGKKLTIIGISDGSSNTIAIVEAGEPVIWTKPDDIPFDPKKEFPKLGTMLGGEFQAVMFDGSVRRFPKSLDRDKLRAMVTISGGEEVDPSSLTFPKNHR